MEGGVTLLHDSLVLQGSAWLHLPEILSLKNVEQLFHHHV